MKTLARPSSDVQEDRRQCRDGVFLRTEVAQHRSAMMIQVKKIIAAFMGTYEGWRSGNDK